jgi:hypothetical protein
LVLNVFTNRTLSVLNFDSSTRSNFSTETQNKYNTFDTALNDTDLETLTSWDSFSDMANGQLYTIE